MSQKNYYLGLDIGTDSVGYAATDESYDLLKCAGKPAWGVTVFDEALLKAKRRSFRTARRRLDRRQQRVIFIQELFANEIAKIDSRFYIRLRESSLFRDETEDRYIFFNDTGFTDVEYNDRYPTIHHLIYDLMTNKDPHDVRLVYLACAWLVAHRGHFLSNINVNNLDDVKDFHGVYESFIGFFTNSGYSAPWEDVDIDRFADVLRKKQRIGSKTSELTQILYGDTKPESESTDEFPFSRKTIVKLLAGGECAPSDLFCKDEYSDLGKFSLDSDETKFTEIMSAIGDDYDIIEALRKVYDWSVLSDALGDETTISEAKVKTYEQHKDDLKTLKYIIRKYLPEKYDEVFRSTKDTSYASYVGHTDNKKENIKRTDKLAFSNNLKKIIQGINPEDEDILVFEDMCSRLELYTFLPKQRDGDNRVIPQQLYQYELQVLLKNAAGYLPFLSEEDEDGITVSDKIMSVFLFKIPYFVGPLNPNSPYAWLERKAGKITPWNFESMVDLDKSEQKFIESMTNTCTYLPGEPVLPKDSLLYHKFTVLNEINNLRINGERISVELKQRIYTDLFMKVKKVTRKRLIDYLECNGYIKSDEREAVTGIDIDIKSNLIPQIAFKRLLDTNTLSVEDVEKIIERASYAEDKRRLEDWLEKTYPNITPVDRKYICGIKIKDFGRLSRKFLEELDGVCKATGEVTSIIEALWNTQNNLMELLSDQYTFIEALEDYINEYYCLNRRTLESRLDDMYISNAVKRPIYRMLDIVKDVKRAFGAPEKIFIETTRGATKEQKGKRTVSRKQQIFDLYDKINNEDVRQLREQIEDMGIEADNKLQGDKLFLYYIQLGKCMYSGKAIKLSELSSKAYDIDHIYPQSYVKDDSIINNKVLSLSEMNGIKGDKYPIDENIRASMGGYWEYLRHAGLISEEKYRRLTRATPFTVEEKYGFINRQLTETSQAAKAAATLLKEFFPNTEIVYCRASLVSEFRQEFDLLKSRTFNDLHHAVDAYLSIVTGNVYSMKFTKQWFNIDKSYSIKTKTLFTRPQICNGKTVWSGEDMLAKVKKTAAKNNAHFNKYQFMKKGELFNQMPLPAAEGLVPRKAGLDTERYGGYNKPSVMFFIPVKYRVGKKSDIMVMSVELMHGKHFLEDESFAREYTKNRLNTILGKEIADYSFPLGMRPWKVNTMLSLDGFRVCISNSANKGRVLSLMTAVQFSAKPYWEHYMKKLEMFEEKNNRNPNYIYSEKYDIVSKNRNEELYDIYIDKLINSIYKKRLSSPLETLKKGRKKFCSLDIQTQTKTLLTIHRIFRRAPGGLNLKTIGGAENTGVQTISTNISNWKKTFTDVRIIDSSASGLWEKQSENLLTLL